MNSPESQNGTVGVSVRTYTKSGTRNANSAAILCQRSWLTPATRSASRSRAAASGR